MSSLLLLFVAQQSLGSRLSSALFDDTFSGIYRLSPFDWALLIPYFGILAILSVYGLHRYLIVYLFLKNRRNAPVPFARLEKLPRVTVQLPIFNELYVVERLLDSVSKLDYPRDLLDVQVLDDSTDVAVELRRPVG